jgi:hypothetical protein
MQERIGFHLDELYEREKTGEIRDDWNYAVAPTDEPKTYWTSVRR